MPDIVFLEVGLETADATDCIMTLGGANYRGLVQLTSSRGANVLTQVKAIGEQQHLQMLPVLSKPFETSVIVKVLQDLKLGQRTALAGRVDLGEALANGWIEFWYQPKIDLRKKQLVGVEAFARARHPVHGVLEPDAFIPAATESSLIALSELALAEALKASVNFAKLGVSLRMAVNMPVNALRNLALVDIVHAIVRASRNGRVFSSTSRKNRSSTISNWRATCRRARSASTSSSRSTISAATIPR